MWPTASNQMSQLIINQKPVYEQKKIILQQKVKSSDLQ
jgi:hypothetical protein